MAESTRVETPNFSKASCSARLLITVASIPMARCLCREFRRRSGGHHEWQVRFLGFRGVFNRRWPDHGAPQGRNIDRQRPDVLTRVSMVGNDLKLDEGVGTCGKDGQAVPVGVGI